MVRFIQATMTSGKTVHFSVDRISAILESSNPTKSSVYTSGNEDPFPVMEDLATLLRAIAAPI